MTLTLETLRKAMPNATVANCTRYLQHINAAMEKYAIDTPMRVSHFLAQIAWESGSLRYSTELASGVAYEGRKDLGNVCVGDGVRFRGRGLIQLTGRANYAAYGRDAGVDFTIDGNWLKLGEPKWAADSAGWFWQRHGLNELADKDEFTKITKIINGSTATVPKRLPYLGDAKRALGLLKKK